MNLKNLFWLNYHGLVVWLGLFSLRVSAGSLRIPVEGQLIYDSSSKMVDLCLSAHMCPPCVFDTLCNQGGIYPMQGTNALPYSSNASPLTSVSTTPTSPLTSVSSTPTSSSSELASTESPSTTEATTQIISTTEEPASSTTASTPSSSSITDHTPSSVSETTSITEATETTESGNLSPTTSVTASATTVGGGIDAETDVHQKGLDKHNYYRKIHNSPALSLSSQLNSDAQKTAERIAAQGKLVHTDDSELGEKGENLGKLCVTDETLEEVIVKVVERWYNEVCKYDFSKPEGSQSTGHFTQLVWASTRELGLGWAKKDEGDFPCYYVAGRYSPGGNIDNRFEENVMKGSFDSSYCSSKRRTLKRLRDPVWPKWYNVIVRSLHHY
ncbi:protein PRY1-like [Stylophora pistillata]|uniref:protein PRY1-like n=1 Tax=Stylophora pistillata TaxID=50429 RepID=UPI000C03B52B|nr:protein PRY1-like [Stylophora pistillata]